MNNQDKLTYLAQIHNKLLTISVKGDDCISMAECLQALRNYIRLESK